MKYFCLLFFLLVKKVHTLYGQVYWLVATKTTSKYFFFTTKGSPPNEKLRDTHRKPKMEIDEANSVGFLSIHRRHVSLQSP